MPRTPRTPPPHLAPSLNSRLLEASLEAHSWVALVAGLMTVNIDLAASRSEADVTATVGYLLASRHG